MAKPMFLPYTEETLRFQNFLMYVNYITLYSLILTDKKLIFIAFSCQGLSLMYKTFK